jgi:hypothetical protein
MWGWVLLDFVSNPFWVLKGVTIGYQIFKAWELDNSLILKTQKRRFFIFSQIPK